MADGSIRVQTKLETKPAEADLAKLEKECKKTAKEIEKVGTKVKTAFTGDSGMKKLGDDCEKTAAKIAEVGNTAKMVFSGMSKAQLGSAFKTANKELAKTEAALADIDAKIAEIQAETDKKLPQAATDEQAANLLAMEEIETAPLLEQREELAAKAAEYKRQLEGITAELNKQTQAEAAQNNLKTSGKTAAADAEWLAKIKTQEQYNAALSTTQTKMAAIEREAARISQETGIAKDKLLQQDSEYQKLSRRLELLTSQTRKFGDEGAKAGKKTSKEMGKATKAVNAVGTSLKNGIKQAGKMALAVIGIRAAFSAVRRAANAYLEDNEQLKNQIESLWNIAGQAIGPFIEKLVQGISTVVVWVNAFIKALTGIDLVAKANAAALKKQANATKEASKAAAQLAGFDEINKLNDDTSAGGGSSSGSDTFDASLAGKIPNFMEEIKKKLLAGDFFGAGETLGDALIKWVKNTDWVSVGHTVGDIIAGVFSFALGFALQLDPMTINGAITGFVAGVFRAVAQGFQKLDWFEIGKSILDFLIFGLAMSNPVTAIITFMLTPNSGELLSSAAELIGSIIGALAASLIGMLARVGEIGKTLWNTIKGYFDEHVDWEGTPGEIIAGLWEGIKAAFVNAGKWIYENIWVPFRDGFKKAFGIASPSKKMAEFGEFIIQGLYNGIGDIWAKISGIFTTFKNKVSGWFTDRATDFKNWGSSVVTGFKNGVGNIWDKTKATFNNAKTAVGLWATDLKEKGSKAGSAFADGIKTGFNAIVEFIKKPINTVIGYFEAAINWIIRQLNKLSFKVPDWVPGIGGETFGFDISEISIYRLAKGGIVNNPGRGVPAVVGEAGREAVLPLENNTEWMDELAERLGTGAGKIIVPIYLNGKKIAEEIIDLTKRRNFATNGAF